VAITDFVDAVTEPGGENYVPPAERIAVFDNDGTLWSEQPMYFQLFFAIDRVREMADQHPEWANEQPFKAVLENDMQALAESGEHGLMQLIMATHTGMSTAEFTDLATRWMNSAKHPRFDRRYNELVYQPMVELLDYLRDNGFKTWIVSGGGIDFMRPWTEAVYGIPPEQVVGSSVVTRYVERDDGPAIIRDPHIAFIDDKEGKPVAIHNHIGRRPIAAFGNSDGDLQMLQWTDAGEGPSLQVIIRHTDATREWAYDRESHIGRLDKALVEADAHGWTVVDMEKEWSVIYPFQVEPQP
jgi:phosphoserine phosphatase